MSEPLVWTEERKERLKAFLEGHRLAMIHCDTEFKHHGRCECMERLAQHWAESESELVELRSQNRKMLSVIRDRALMDHGDIERALLKEIPTADDEPLYPRGSRVYFAKNGCDQTEWEVGPSYVDDDGVRRYCLKNLVGWIAEDRLTPVNTRSDP